MKELSRGWTWATLSDLIASDGVFSDGDWVETKDQDPNGEVRLTQLADIGEGAFRDRSSRFMTAESAERLGCTYLEPGDVLVARMPDPLGRACLYPGGRTPAVTAVDVCIVRPGSGSVDRRWLMWWLNAPQFRAEVAARQSGTTRKRISRKNLAAIRFPLPPLPEQRRIVAAIEEHLSRLEAAVSQVEVANKRLRKLRSRIVDRATTGPWQKRPFDDVIQSLRNGVFVSRPNAQPPGIPIFRISAVRPMALDADDIRYAPASETFPDEGFVEEGDLLFTRYSGNPAYVGACAVVPLLGRKTLHPDKLIRVAVDRERCLPEYIEIAFASTVVRREVEVRLKTTAGQVGIAGGQLRTVPLPLPPLEVQRQIVANIRGGLSVADALSSALQRASLRAEGLRRSVLARAFRGELLAHDPNDEPASVLLERIAAERAAAPAPTRKRRLRAPA